jgi:hypothetical protein
MEHELVRPAFISSADPLRRRIGFAALCLLLGTTVMALAQLGPAVRIPTASRSEMIQRAKELAAHGWTSGAANLHASCSSRYVSDWRLGQHITGIPYSWGGSDDSKSFDTKILKGLAAGGHSRYGVLSCTTGIDCSAFVTYCWGMKGHPYSTRNLEIIAARPKYNLFTDMKPGDALVKPGSHVVLFTGYNPDGTINICEASGSAARVVCHGSTWSKLRGYAPLQYKGVEE